jgi:oligopeptide/dipeptide ABC transporter ATP-binding protein
LSVVERFCDRVAIMYLGRIVETATAAELFARPRHPYTRALLDAVPRLDPGARRPPALRGEPPNAALPPPGCVFSGRCGFAEPACRQTEPALRDDHGHTVACHRWRELADEGWRSDIAVAELSSQVPAIG